MNDVLLQVEDLRVEYLEADGSTCVVDGVSFEIRPGEVLGLAGESGSGKTTIVQAILRIVKRPGAITGGHIYYRGRDVLDMDAEALRRFRWNEVSLVMQSAMNALNPVMSVQQQIQDVLRSHTSITRRGAMNRIAELLDLVGVGGDRASAYPHELSGGMRQRVVIAMALALRPSLVLMDEPTTALDVVVQKEILQRISSLQEELGFSVLFITHDLSLMFELCSHIGILYGGRICEIAPTERLLHHAQHPYTQGLMKALPELDDIQSNGLSGIPGTPPDMRNPPTGCRFHPRCPRTTDLCRSFQPERTVFDDEGNHHAYCHGVTP
jgi:peptide/nickel transport system ATP-binding protein